LRESSFLAHTMTTTNLSVVGSGPICAPIDSYLKTIQTSVTYVYKIDREVSHLDIDMDIEKAELLAWIATFKQMFDKCCFTS